MSSAIQTCPTATPNTPDVARGLAVLGTAAGRVWHLPVAAQLTTRALLERVAEQGPTALPEAIETTLAAHQCSKLA